MLPVEMTTRKTVMVLALVLVAALMVTALPALAWTNSLVIGATVRGSAVVVDPEIARKATHNKYAFNR